MSDDSTMEKKLIHLTISEKRIFLTCKVRMVFLTNYDANTLHDISSFFCNLEFISYDNGNEKQ